MAPIYLWVLRRVGISLTSLGRHLFWPGVAGAVGGVAAVFVTHAVDGNLKKLAVGGSLGLLAYGLCVLPVKGLITPNPRVRT